MKATICPWVFEDESITTKIKAIEQHFPVVLFIMLYNVVLTFESLEEDLIILHEREHLNKTFEAIAQLLSVVLLKCYRCTEVFLLFQSVDEILLSRDLFQSFAF